MRSLPRHQHWPANVCVATVLMAQAPNYPVICRPANGAAQVVNALPLPALDGGFLALLALEAVRGKKLSQVGVMITRAKPLRGQALAGLDSTHAAHDQHLA